MPRLQSFAVDKTASAEIMEIKLAEDLLSGRLFMAYS